MTLLAYGVTGGGAPLPDVFGVDGQPVERLTVDDLSIAFSIVDRVQPRPEPDAALAYGRVLDAIHAAGTVVPLRYGLTASDHDRLAGLVRSQADWFHSTLARLDGLTEMTLWIALDPAVGLPLGLSSTPSPTIDETIREPREGPTAGVNYLRRRKAVFAVKDAGATSRCVNIIAAAFPIMRSLKAERRLEPEPGLAIRALIPREDVRALQLAVATHPIMGALRWVVTGGSPPFNFVESPAVCGCAE